MTNTCTRCQRAADPDSQCVVVILGSPLCHSCAGEFQDLEALEGLFVGQLDERELRILNDAAAVGFARRSYDGPAGLFGLAKVKINRTRDADNLLQEAEIR